MSVEVVFEDDEIQVIFRAGTSLSTLVAFSAIIHRPDEKWFWAASPADKMDLNCICFSPKRKNYFPRSSVEAAFQAVKNLIIGDVVTYGASMGGYAAIKYSKIFSAKAILAFSPQSSIDPADVPFDVDRRMYFIPSLHQSMKVQGADLSGELALFYDPRQKIDQQHVDCMQDAFKETKTHTVLMYYCGHDAITVMVEAKAFGELYIEATTGTLKSVNSIIASSKKRSRTFLMNLGRYALRSGRVGAALGLWLRAEQLGISRIIVGSVRSVELFNSGHVEMARQAALAAAGLDKEEPHAESLTTLGWVLKQTGCVSEAIAAYGKAVSAEPRVLKHIIEYTAALGSQRRFRESLNAGLHATEFLKNEPELWGRIGWDYLALDEKVNAEGAFLRAISLGSDIKHLQIGLAKARQ